jgi:acetate kinase
VEESRHDEFATQSDMEPLMRLLVINAGSSSVKAAVFATGASGAVASDPAWSGEVRWESLPAQAQLAWTTPLQTGTTTVTVDGHGGAVRAIAAAVHALGPPPDVTAHRVVHGLTCEAPAFVDAGVRAAIERAIPLAPLHNRAALDGIDATAAVFPNARIVAVFDTAFHATLPPAAAIYPLPYAYADEGIRRYGFHGISHKYCAARTAEALRRPLAELRIITAHLGNGCSLAAVDGGRSIDTTMGFTPLEGLMMGGRSGSIDPGLLIYLLRERGLSVDALDRMLNEESGLRGLSGISEDIRPVLAAARAGDERAQTALDVYVHRLCAGIGAMAAALGGCDAIGLTGGVGENSAEIRRSVRAGSAFLGSVRIVVVPAREEYAIAVESAALVQASAAAGV